MTEKEALAIVIELAYLGKDTELIFSNRDEYVQWYNSYENRLRAIEIVKEMYENIPD